MDIPPIIGRYEILERVARGGMGALYRARDPVLEREVAIKVMLADFSHDAIGRARFYREARAVARLQHRNIVTLFDFGEDENSPYIVMEYLQGRTLGARVKHGPPVTLPEALDIGAQLCTGLHFAHAHGVVHRDVKPANIWLLDDGGVKLLDFGIAKFGDTDVTQAGDVLGSVSYMSPEQLSGGTIDGRSDIFSAGILLYELLSGRRPFQGESPTAIMMRIIHDEPPPLDAVPGAPPALRTIVARALEKQQDRRYQRAAELAAELRELQGMLERRAVDEQREARSQAGEDAHAVPAGTATGQRERPVSSGPVTGAGTLASQRARAESPAAPLSEEAPSDEDARDRLHDPLASHHPHEPLIRASAGHPLESYDPAGDMVIGEHSGPAFPAAGARRSTMTSLRARKTWLTAGVGVAAAAVALVTVLLVRGESLRPGGSEGDGRTKAPDTRTRTPDGPPGPTGPVTPSGSAGAGTGNAASKAGPATASSPGTGTATAGAAAGSPTGTPGGTSTGASGGAPADTSAASGTGSTSGAAAGTGASSTSFQVIVTGAYPFEVSGEGGMVSRARARHELTLSGWQSLRLRAAQYCLDRQVKVQGAPGSVVRAYAPALGRLTVRTAYETCQISLGGYALGYPPIAERPVASGTYRLTLRCPDGDNQSESVTIAPGQTYVALIR